MSNTDKLTGAEYRFSGKELGPAVAILLHAVMQEDVVDSFTVERCLEGEGNDAILTVEFLLEITPEEARAVFAYDPLRDAYGEQSDSLD